FAGQTYNTPIFVGPRPNTAFAQITEIRSDVVSKYHALVLQANRRLTRGLQFQSNYTLSRSSDTGQTSTTFTTNNLPFNAFSGQRVTGNISGNITPTSFGFPSNTTPGGGINGSGGSSRFALVPRNFFKQPNI